jgi:hypothetical protein
MGDVPEPDLGAPFVVADILVRRLNDSFLRQTVSPIHIVNDSTRCTPALQFTG